MKGVWCPFAEPKGGSQRRPRVRDVQRGRPAPARRGRDVGADAVPGSPGRQYQKTT